MGFGFTSYGHGAGLSFPVPLQADGNVVIVLDAAFMGKSSLGAPGVANMTSLDRIFNTNEFHHVLDLDSRALNLERCPSCWSNPESVW